MDPGFTPLFWLAGFPQHIIYSFFHYMTFGSSMAVGLFPELMYEIAVRNDAPILKDHALSVITSQPLTTGNVIRRLIFAHKNGFQDMKKAACLFYRSHHSEIHCTFWFEQTYPDLAQEIYNLGVPQVGSWQY